MSEGKVKPLTSQEREIFEKSFRTCGTSRMQCQCGKWYYNSTGGWDWDEGELEEYHADKQAIDVDYTIGRLVFDGQEYADACDCWEEAATRIYRWLIANRYAVTAFYPAVKQEMKADAEQFPIVG